MALIPFGEYLPDLPVYQNPGATVALNVVPITSKSYGPFAAYKALTTAMANRCQGGFGGKDLNGVVYQFAGDATKLWLWNVTTWDDVSVAGDYIVANDAMWQFVQYGNRLIACAPSNNLQTFLLGTDTDFSALSATAPQASYLAIIRDFLMVGNTYDATDGAVPNQVWWSAIDAPTSWPTPGTAAATAVQSDKQVLPEGGAIQGVVGAVGGADGAVFLEEAIYRVTYLGSPLIFQFDKVEKQKGTRVPGSLVNMGTAAFYLGVDGFYAFDGANSVPIGNEKIDKSFYRDFDQTYYYRVTSVVDVINKQVLWAYPGSGNIGGQPNKILVYNWSLNRWSLVEQDVEVFFRSYTKSYTLEQLDPFGNMDTLPYSLDSRIWSGGSMVLSVVSSDHTLGSFAGNNLAATLETGEFDAGNGQRVFVSGIRPVVDGGTATAAVGTRDATGETVTYGTATAAEADGVCPQRVSARYARARVQIAADGSWTHALGIEPIVQPDGDR